MLLSPLASWRTHSGRGSSYPRFARHSSATRATNLAKAGRRCSGIVLLLRVLTHDPSCAQYLASSQNRLLTNAFHSLFACVAARQRPGFSRHHVSASSAVINHSGFSPRYKRLAGITPFSHKRLTVLGSNPIASANSLGVK